MKNYYLILSISTQATQAQIKAAYKARLAEWQNTDSNNMTRYMDIEEAWENLGDEMRRKWYDDRFLSRLQQEERTSQARASEIYQYVKQDLAEKKSFTSLSKKVAVGGLSGGAIYFIMHFAFMVYHLAPHPEPEFKQVDFSDMDSSLLRRALDSMVQHSIIDTSQSKPADAP